MQKQAGDNSKHPEYRNGTALFHSNHADMLRPLGRAAEARDGYERAIAIRKRMVKEVP